MIGFTEIKEACIHLLFPHICDGCGSDLLESTNQLCMRCMEALPSTHFELYPGNPVEKRFYGRLPLLDAAALFYFSKETLMARLVHQVKYKANKELGIQLGKIMGNALKQSGRFVADGLVALPLYPAREKKRGFNQSMLLCEGISEFLSIPIWKNIISRPHATETQTKKGRIERWENMEGKFRLDDPDAIKGKRILLIDDVITTGATLESCGAELLKADGTRLSIACLCHAFN